MLSHRLFQGLSSCTVLVVASVAFAGDDVGPPSPDEAVSAFARHATQAIEQMGLLGTDNDQRYAQQMGKINVFASRMRLGACNQRSAADDPFLPADAPRPAVVFDCKWSTGERISFTRLANTGSWMVSDQATTAEGMGMKFVGVRPAAVESTVASIAIAPMKSPTPIAPDETPSPAAQSGTQRARLQASLGTAAALGRPILTPKDLPSPFVAPGGLPAALPTPVAVDPGPMPTPYASR